MSPLEYKKILIIGAGAIALRHKAILCEFGCDVKVLSRRSDVGNFTTIDQACNFSYDLILICNETSLHFETYSTIVDYFPGVPVFVEKPLAHKLSEALLFNKQKCWVGYNLRFHPIMTAIKEFIDAQACPPYYAEFHVGQDLNSWRPSRAVKNSYSAHKFKGGGAILDLSHEIDLSIWLLGEWVKLNAIVSKVSDKTVDSEDLAMIIAKTKNGSNISINMNYLDIKPIRNILISGADYIIRCDLIKSKLTINNNEKFYEDGMNKSYINMWQSILLNNHNDLICTFEEALKVQHAIDSINKNAIS